MKVELGVRDVREIAGANGYVIQAVGFIHPPDIERDVWANEIPRDTFWPAHGLSVKLELEWHGGGPKPGLAEFGSTLFIDMEPGTVPAEPVNRGPLAPESRRY